MASAGLLHLLWLHLPPPTTTTTSLRDNFLLTAQPAELRDYDSTAVSLGSIKGARLSGLGIDGGYELLAREESNIAGIHDWRPAAEITNDCGALV